MLHDIARRSLMLVRDDSGTGIREVATVGQVLNGTLSTRDRARPNTCNIIHLPTAHVNPRVTVTDHHTESAIETSTLMFHMEINRRATVKRINPTISDTAETSRILVKR